MKRGFTLAEVLITLGVIGVVAAMTLPVLIQNMNKQAWVSGLLKTYTTLEQGFKMVLVDENVEDFGNSSCIGGYEDFKNCMLKYFKASEVSLSDYVQKPITTEEGPYYTASQTKTSAIALADGTLVFYGGNGNVGHVFFTDVNGKKGPNTYGRDIFAFIVGTSNSGRKLIYPVGLGTLYNVNDEYVDSAVSATCALNFGNCQGHFIGENDISGEAVAVNDDISRECPGVGYTPKVLFEKKMDY